MTAGAGTIALLGPAPPDRGGIARETALLAQELARRVPVSYLTFSRPYPRWLDPRRFDRDARLSASPAEPVLDYLSPRSWTGTARLVADRGARALVVPWWTAFWGIPIRSVLRRLRSARRETARVLICHNVEDHEGGIAHRLLSLGAFFEADGFLVHSEDARRALQPLARGKPIAVAPLPAAPEVFPPRDEARRKLSDEGLDRQGPLVLFLGLVRRYKGVEVLIEAAPAIVGESGARIAIVGESFPDARDVEERWKGSPARDRIFRKDEYVPEEELSQWLAACDVLVLPYRKIAGSAMAARGLAAGRPMAAAAVGGLPETVVPGVTGELFPAGEPAALAEAVLRILGRGPGFYEGGLARAAERASWPGYADALLGLVGSLSGETPGDGAPPRERSAVPE